MKLVGSRRLVGDRIEGTKAYGVRQAHIQRHLFATFKLLWRDVPALIVSPSCRDVTVVLDLDSRMIEELSRAASFLG
jgi:hypothetical protein